MDKKDQISQTYLVKFHKPLYLTTMAKNSW